MVPGAGRVAGQRLYLLRDPQRSGKEDPMSIVKNEPVFPFKEEDATAMMTSVHCAFADDKKADAGPRERTLSNCTCDLTKTEISVRWYLGAVGPIEGTNQMQDCMTDFNAFGF